MKRRSRQVPSPYQRSVRFFYERVMLAGYFFIVEPKIMMMRDLASRLFFDRAVSNFMLELPNLKTKAHMVTNCGSVPIFFWNLPILCMYLNHTVKKFFLVCLLHTTYLYQRRGENTSVCSRKRPHKVISDYSD